MNARAPSPSAPPPATSPTNGSDPRPTLELELGAVERTMGRLARSGQIDRAGAMASEQLATGGKRLRARLALSSCRAFEVDTSACVPWAAAVELLHNATLIHDDIQDGDRTRRGEPTLWVKHGVAQAINAGDLMLMLPFLALAELPARQAGQLSRLLAEHASRTVRGQVEELGLLSSGRLDWDSYLHAVAGKTGALLALPVLGAAILAGREDAFLSDIDQLFCELGITFQLQDDVVDLFGDKGREVVGCDIYEGKVSALVVLQLSRRPDTRTELLDMLAKPRELTTPADVARARHMFSESGALDELLAAISLRANAIRQSSVLLREPRLRRLTEDLLGLALAPIGHLLSGASR